MSKFKKIKLIINIFIWNILVNILLRFSSVNFMLTVLTPRKNKEQYPKSHIIRIVDYVDFVLNRCHFFSKKTCLKRSLVLYRLLRSFNCDVDIHIGVRNDRAKINGHSWLTLNGQVFADSEEKINDFVPIYRYPI